MNDERSWIKFTVTTHRYVHKHSHIYISHWLQSTGSRVWIGWFITWWPHNLTFCFKRNSYLIFLLSKHMCKLNDSKLCHTQLMWEILIENEWETYDQWVGEWLTWQTLKPGPFIRFLDLLDPITGTSRRRLWLLTWGTWQKIHTWDMLRKRVRKKEK